MDIDQTQANVGPALPRPPAPRGQGSASREEFAAVIGRMDAGTMKPEDRAQEGARQLVSTALVQPVLKSLRESNRAAPPFAPSQGERTFRAMMDTNLAQNLVKSGRWPLVDRVAQSLLRNTSQGAGAAEPSAPGSEPVVDAA